MGIYLGVPPDSVIDYSDKLVNGKKLNETVSASYAACEMKGATMPALSAQTADNLSGTIGTIRILTPLTLSSLEVFHNDPNNTLNIVELGNIFENYYPRQNITINLPVVKRIGNSTFQNFGYVNFDHVTMPNVEEIGSDACNNFSGNLSFPKLRLFDMSTFLNGDITAIDLPSITAWYFDPNSSFSELLYIRANGIIDSQLPAIDNLALISAEFNSLTSEWNIDNFCSIKLSYLEFKSIEASGIKEVVEENGILNGSEWTIDGYIRTDLPILIKCKNDIILSANYDEENRKWVATY